MGYFITSSLYWSTMAWRSSWISRVMVLWGPLHAWHWILCGSSCKTLQSDGKLQFVFFLLTIGSTLVNSSSNISEDVRTKFLKVFWHSLRISTSRESYRSTCRRLSIHGRALVLRLLLLLMMWIWWPISSIKLCWSWCTVIASRIVAHVVCHGWSIFWRFCNDPFHTHDSADECTTNTSESSAFIWRCLNVLWAWPGLPSDMREAYIQASSSAYNSEQNQTSWTLIEEFFMQSASQTLSTNEFERMETKKFTFPFSERSASILHSITLLTGITCLHCNNYKLDNYVNMSFVNMRRENIRQENRDEQ